jgi:arylsulfatase A-like enzyme
MDFELANQKVFNHGDSSYLYKKYGAATVSERQKLLLPFFWNTVATQGQLYGNRFKENKVNVANPHWFSYPGYNEIFTGYPDSIINSNDYPPNPYSNFLGFLQQQKEYKGKVVAFAAWDAYDRILNEAVSGFPVINGFESVSSILKDPISENLSNLLKDSYQPFKKVECLDVFTHYQAMHYLKTKQPKVMYISYGETDEWAHHGNYSNYLDAAHQVDAWLNDIWNYVQNTKGYKNNTYILITTDHGRGFGSEWTTHGADVKGAANIWFALLGPGLQKIGPLGEQTKTQQLYQKQLAATITKLLGHPFKAEHPIGEAIY